MDKRDFKFLQDNPQFEPIVAKILKRYATYHYDDIWVVIDMIYRAGLSQGIARALDTLGFRWPHPK